LNIFIIPFLIFISAQGNTIQEKQTIIAQINKPCNSITTDQLGNLYLINDYKITMYDHSGDSLREFNSRKYGNITSVDASNPYKILVFFQDYNLIVYLDNYLSQNGDEVELQELGYDQIGFACQSRIKGIWIFDPIIQKIIKLDENHNRLKESINLAQWFGNNIQPNYMIEYNNQLFLNDKKLGVFIFDHFGTFLKRIRLENATFLQVMNDKINFNTVNQFCQYNLKSIETNCEILERKSIDQIRIEKNRVYYKEGNSISIYETN
jgi:hypothetical protein